MILHLIMGLALQQAGPEPQQDSGTAEAEIAVESAAAADVAADAAADAAEPATPAEPAPPAILIPRDTPVRLMVLSEVSTKDHEPGHRFRLRVNEAVMIDGIERIPVGAAAWGELVDATRSGNVGKSGKLSARLLYIELGGREIPIEGETTAEGKSGKGETILGVIGLGPLGLFAKGNNAKIKAGEMMTAFIAEDVIEGDAQ